MMIQPLSHNWKEEFYSLKNIREVDVTIKAICELNMDFFAKLDILSIEHLRELGRRFDFNFVRGVLAGAAWLVRKISEFAGRLFFGLGIFIVALTAGSIWIDRPVHVSMISLITGFAFGACCFLLNLISKVVAFILKKGEEKLKSRLDLSEAKFDLTPLKKWVQIKQMDAEDRTKEFVRRTIEKIKIIYAKMRNGLFEEQLLKDILQEHEVLTHVDCKIIAFEHFIHQLKKDDEHHAGERLLECLKNGDYRGLKDA